MLKKISTVLVALALVSCAQQPPDKDTAYLSYARSHESLQDSAFTDRILLDMAHASCKALRSGRTMREPVRHDYGRQRCLGLQEGYG